MSGTPTAYSIDQFGRKAPFSSFLPGVAGMHGIPLWCFYVNRGQAIAGFGSLDKHHSIMEFSPANAAYQRVPTTGFRTFIKLGSEILEPFVNGLGKMEIEENALTIHWEDPGHRISISVRYFIIPNASVGALARRVEISNLSSDPLYAEILDGMSAIVPYGLNQHALKMMSQTAKAWIMVEGLNEHRPYFRLRTSLEDTTTVEPIEDGSFGVSVSEGQFLPVIVDPSVIFGWDLSLVSPVQFASNSLSQLLAVPQRQENELPCCFFALARDLKPQQPLRFDSLFGLVHGQTKLAEFSSQLLDVQWLNLKEKQAEELLAPYLTAIETHTSNPLFDRYCRQSYIDNFLRGGVPCIFANENQKQLFYLYSRKHGDPERDYNEFVVTPEYASQGNGNFRDVLQNRRSDVRFCPAAGWAPLKPFLELIQSDGYNPLVIQPVTFKFDGERTQDLPPKVIEVLKHSFTPGLLLNALEGVDAGKRDQLLNRIMCASQPEVNAAFAEGYWVDHWIYLLDLLESYQSIYPEKVLSLLTERSLRWYESKAAVRPLHARCVVGKNGLRQHNALDETIKAHISHNWLRRRNGKELFSTPLEKFFMLCILKFASIDASGEAISMEAGKPGWYDALNGLPALFGSSTPECCELWRLVQFLLDTIAEEDISLSLPEDMAELAVTIAAVAELPDSVERWEKATHVLEEYRAQTLYSVSDKDTVLTSCQVKSILTRLLHCISRAVCSMINRTQGVVPTYFTNLPDRWDVSGNGVMPCHFDHRELPPFLEGTVHALRLPLTREQKFDLLQRVRHSSLWDEKLKMYKVSADLSKETPELGRANAFTRGWLEHESIWLHMEYKYLLEMLKNGFYDLFFESMADALIPFQPEERYGRSILENSSFLASSANPDPATHGRGFVARLSGATAEFMEIWQTMFFGHVPFSLSNGELTLAICPALPACLIPESHEVSAAFLGHTKVTYILPDGGSVTPDTHVVSQWKLTDQYGVTTTIHSPWLRGAYASAVRNGEYATMEVTLDRK